MKKLLSLLLAASMLLALTACGGKEPDNSADAPSSTSTGTAPTEPGTDNPTDTPTGEPTAQPDGNSDETPDVPQQGTPNTAIAEGAYLYNGAFLANGRTTPLNESGASIDMPSVTVSFNDGDMVFSYLLDGESPAIDPENYPITPIPIPVFGECAHLQLPTPVSGSVGISESDEDAANARYLCVYAPMCGAAGTDYALNELDIGQKRGAELRSFLIEALGDPAGAYCQGGTYPLVTYFWKSGNFNKGNLILALATRYDNNLNEQGTILHVFLTDYMDGILEVHEPNGSGDFHDMAAAMKELGLY